MQTQLVSAVASNALERHDVPVLEKIDSVDVTLWRKTVIPNLSNPRLLTNTDYRMVTSPISDPTGIKELVALMNDNRLRWENPPLNLAPAIHPRPVDARPLIVFWSGKTRVRDVRLAANVLTTQIDSRTIQREISAKEAERILRLIGGDNVSTGIGAY